MTADQIAAVVEEIRDRVQGRYQKTAPQIPDFELPRLDRLEQARDAAEGKVAAIGRVNPRRPGPLNAAIQASKKLLARILRWHVREQIDFNRAAVRFMDATLEAKIGQNDNLLRVALGLSTLQNETAGLEARVAHLARQQEDVLRHWEQWRPAWEDKLTETEIHFLHTVREIESAAREREDRVLKMHQEYLDALTRTTDQLQERFWSDLRKLRTDQEHLIHTELRLIRRRAQEQRAQPDGAAGRSPSPAPSGDGAGIGPANGQAAAGGSIDYARLEERFRGDEAYVTEAQKFYLPYFQDCRNVLDLGCGRGEFLNLLREEGVWVLGVDHDPDAVAACREKGLSVEQGDLFAFLSSRPDGSLDGIFSAHVVEHLPPNQLPALVELAAAKLTPGGIAAFETPNPNCLAIFAGDFFLDPTHRRPVPSRLLHFYMEEDGFGDIEIHELHPASELFPEIAALDKLDELRDFRRRFFGGLDYAIVGRKLRS